MTKVLRSIMLAVAFGSLAQTVAVTCAADETAPRPVISLRWEWSGTGHFPPTLNLTLMHTPDGTSFALLEEWGQLKSVNGWGELQRSHSTTFGSIRQLGNRNFVVLASLQRAAEYEIGQDGVLRLSWFVLETPEPTEADLLSAKQHGATSDLPGEMRPSWAPSPRPAGPNAI